MLPRRHRAAHLEVQALFHKRSILLRLDERFVSQLSSVASYRLTSFIDCERFGLENVPRVMSYKERISTNQNNQQTASSPSPLPRRRSARIAAHPYAPHPSPDSSCRSGPSPSLSHHESPFDVGLMQPRNESGSPATRSNSRGNSNSSEQESRARFVSVTPSTAPHAHTESRSLSIRPSTRATSRSQAVHSPRDVHEDQSLAKPMSIRTGSGSLSSPAFDHIGSMPPAAAQASVTTDSRIPDSRSSILAPSRSLPAGLSSRVDIAANGDGCEEYPVASQAIALAGVNATYAGQPSSEAGPSSSTRSRLGGAAAWEDKLEELRRDFFNSQEETRTRLDEVMNAVQELTESLQTAHTGSGKGKSVKGSRKGKERAT